MATMPGSQLASQSAPAGGATLDRITPPKIKGTSWLGIDPKATVSTSLAREGLQGYLGSDIAPHMGLVTDILRKNGYTDPTFGQNLTGAQYNALLQAGADATGNTFTPYSTDTGTTDRMPMDPTPPPTTQGDDAPALELPIYQRRGDFSFNPSNLETDPGYQFQVKEGMRALTNSAASRGGVRGTNTMRDMVSFGQGLASTNFDSAYRRAADTWDRNVGDDRYAHEAESGRRQTEYAPRLLNWERNRDERRRDIEMNFNRDWEREQYGREDAWRRHVYQNDDQWRRYQLEEQRRQRLAEMGLV